MGYITNLKNNNALTLLHEIDGLLHVIDGLSVIISSLNITQPFLLFISSQQEDHFHCAFMTF